jgi:putative ABC transport system ATP-binding protein
VENAGLQVERVTKRFGSGETEVVAVRDVSLRVNPGEVVLIMGPVRLGEDNAPLDARRASQAH